MSPARLSGARSRVSILTILFGRTGAARPGGGAAADGGGRGGVAAAALARGDAAAGHGVTAARARRAPRAPAPAPGT